MDDDLFYEISCGNLNLFLEEADSTDYDRLYMMPVAMQQTIYPVQCPEGFVLRYNPFIPVGPFVPRL